MIVPKSIETFNKLFIHQRTRVVAVYSVSMIEEVINVNPRNTSPLPPPKGLIETIPSRQGRAFQPSNENPLYPRSPLIAGERGKNIAVYTSLPLLSSGLSLRDINIIARVNVIRTCSRPCTCQLRVYHARHEHPGGNQEGVRGRGRVYRGKLFSQ